MKQGPLLQVKAAPTHAPAPERPRVPSSGPRAGHPLAQLGRTVGNQGVLRLLRSGPVLQSKLQINEPGDAYEQEADRLADQITRGPSPPMVQRRCADCAEGKPCPSCAEDEQEPLRRTAIPGSGSPADVTAVVGEALQSPGRPLDPAVRDAMERRFGIDFGHVRIHEGERAAASARSVNAVAYTVGRDIVFDDGRYAPGTVDGVRLLAHELTHVVQQGHAVSVARRFAGGETPAGQGPNTDAAAPVSDEPQLRAEVTLIPTSKSLQRACPTTPTGIGRTPSTELCTRLGPALVVGDILLFCQDSNELETGQKEYLASLIAQARTATRVEIHGNASTEGPAGDYNFNLACKRAAQIGREFRGAGISTPIALFTHGPTSAYGPLAANRNAVIMLTQPPKESPTPPHTGAPCEDARPPILKVEGDTVVVINAQGFPEKISMNAFGSSQWEPGNPGNPAVTKANECYRTTRLQILTQAGRRPTATFESCNDDQKRILTSSFRLAGSSVDTALEKLRLAKEGAEAGLVQVERHFKARDPKDIQVIIDNFARVKAELGNVAEFYCGGIFCRLKHDLAWTMSLGALGQGINVCPDFFGLTLLERALTVVHESCHHAFGASDDAYYADSLALPRDKAMRNAENYGNFALGKFNP